MRLFAALAVGCCLGVMAFALEPVGTASSSDEFFLNGVTAATAGVSSWPLAPGDEVRAGRSAVLIRFQDGSRLTLSQQGRLKLQRNGSELAVNVIGGEAQFSLSSQSAIRVLNSGRQVNERSGVISTRVPSTAGSSGGQRPEIVHVPPPPTSTQ